MKITTKNIKDIKSFTIDRSKWVRGDIGGDSKLLNEQGNMCCLGQYAKACGFSDEQLFDLASPEDLYCEIKLDKSKLWSANFHQEDLESINWKTKLVDLTNGETHDSYVVFKLMDLNDNCTFLTEKEREIEIRASFAKLGIKVKFKN